MNIASYVTAQLPYLVPLLLLYLVGAVISLAYRRRLGTPAALALASCLLLFVVTLAFPFMQGYLVESHTKAGGGFSSMRRPMLLLGVASSLLQATGLALLLAAVFHGRFSSAESASRTRIAAARDGDASPRQPR